MLALVIVIDVMLAFALGMFIVHDVRKMREFDEQLLMLRNSLGNLEGALIYITGGDPAAGMPAVVARPHTRPTSAPDHYSIEDEEEKPKRRRRAKERPVELSDEHEARLEDEGLIPEDR